MIDYPFSRAIGGPVTDSEGRVLGPLEGVYYGEETGEPTWLRVLGNSRSLLVPVTGCVVGEAGVRAPWPADRIEAAPVDPGDHLPRRLELELLDYFGLAPSVVRHAEVATVGTEVVERGRVRLHKVVESLPITVVAEVEVERLELTRELLRAPVGGASWAEESIEVPIHRQTASLRKRVVARERVALERGVTEEQHTVTDMVRVERVEVEGDAADGSQEA